MTDYEEIKRERDHYKEKLDRLQKNGRLNAYLVIQGQIDSFLEQLTIRTEINQKGQKPSIAVFGYIDLFAGKDSKEFDRAKWFLENYLSLINSQKALYVMLTDEEQKEVDGKKVPDIPTTTDWDSVRKGIEEKIKNGTTEKKRSVNN